ncbi:hypothetical protein [Deinococcus sp. AJ005]|uniref:hypothetical protein n=1 Tax=Deinococcus sp. AJ005 TaxID=2652443 RepID=UPI00125CC44C|nr:hypothetical protein [Deinococcus sp. AJ005]QFP75053.1 hypothetical protein DAAJ005_00350 [Deinococcus sp. AJ005]
MHTWMLEAPEHEVTPADLAVFAAAWDARDVGVLPGDLPRWLFLQWLTEQGYLLHGSQSGELTELVGAQKEYGQADEFSNTIGVYAASDGLWAMMYALRGPEVAQQSDMALQVLERGQWSTMRYFMSVAPRTPGGQDARALLASGFVYVLPRAGFAQSPPYDHDGLGHVQEAHWVNPHPVTPLLHIPVTPDDLPLPVCLHDAEQVKTRSKADPWGFPWLAATDDHA